MAEILANVPDTISPGSVASDEANQPEERFDSYPDVVELSDSLHDAETLESLARALEQKNDWEESNGLPVDGAKIAHQIRELDHLLSLNPTDEVQNHIDNLIAALPVLPDLQDAVVRIMNRGEN